MEDKLIPLLAGAILTLTVSVILQAVVVPWVQARNRRLERWETSVLDLASLIEEELPRAVSEFRSATEAELYYRAFEGGTAADAESLHEGLQQASAERRAAMESIGQHRKRLKLLVNRVVRVRRHAPAWRHLQTARIWLSHNLSSLTFPIAREEVTSFTDEKWSQAWAEYQVAEMDLARLVDDLATSMRPPPLELRRRTWNWITFHALRLGRRSRQDVGHDRASEATTIPSLSRAMLRRQASILNDRAVGRTLGSYRWSYR